MELSVLLLLCLFLNTQSQDGVPADGVPAGFLWRQKNVNVRERRSLDGGVDFNTLPDNLTRSVEDSQRYYSWKSFGPNDRRTKNLWIDLKNLNKSQVRIHGLLSNAHKQAARVALSFDFPFYGHNVRQIIVATGGFIFMGEMGHRMLTATQYVAPLMANFDPSFSTNSTVGYWDNGRLFAVQWDRVRLKEREDEGHFTFQAALHRNGTIAFNYRHIPVPVEQLNSSEHPVKVGLSDAFVVLLPPGQLSDVRRRSIYEYHRVEMDATKIVSGSSFLFSPLTTCVQHATCELCLSNATLGCSWCNVLQRCSDGIDRHRQEWLDYNCPHEAQSVCEDFVEPEGSLSPFNQSSTSPPTLPVQPVTSDLQAAHASGGGGGVPESTAIVAGVVAALVLVVAVTLLAVYYIHTHPASCRRSNNYWPSMKFHNQSYTEVEVGGHDRDVFLQAEQCC